MPNTGLLFLRPSDLLEKLKTVDGSGSGLDADNLDGQDSTYYAKASDLSNHINNTNNPHQVTCSQIGAATQTALDNHINDTNNPHQVTCAQIGAATQTALDNHINDKSNPHQVTPEQIGAPQKLTSPFTVTVGSGGDFSTINEALAYLVNNYHPGRPISGGYIEYVIKLLSGYVMSEQVIVDKLDLSWISILSEDPEVTIQRSALTIYVSDFDTYPAFCAMNSGELPRLFVQFVMDNSGDGTKRDGIVVGSSSRAALSKGVKNAARYGLYVLKGSNVYVGVGNFSGAGDIGIRAEGGSVVDAENVDVSGCGGVGIYVSDGSMVNAKNANASYCGSVGIYVEKGSIVNADGANVSYSQSHGLYVRNGSVANARGLIATNCSDEGILAEGGSYVNASDADGSASAHVAYVLSGSIINAYAATGTLSQTANSITSNGIIFH
ncbi:MAG: right-handed parallel beta-helix repeat-containing protein [Candidatus Methanospirareceae archaeon]